MLIHPPGYARAGETHYSNLTDDHWRIIIDALAKGNVVGLILCCDNAWMGATIALRVAQRCDFVIEAAHDRDDGVLYFYRTDAPKAEAPARCGESYNAEAVEDALGLCEELIDHGKGHFTYPNPTDLCVWLNNEGRDNGATYEAFMAIAPIVRRVRNRRGTETNNEDRPEETGSADSGGA